MMRNKKLIMGLSAFLLGAACSTEQPSQIAISGEIPVSKDITAQSLGEEGYAIPLDLITTPTNPPTTTTTTPPPPPTTAPQVAVQQKITPTPVSGQADPYNDANWDLLAGCEANGNWHISTGNGYYGGLQFKLSSWRLVGGTGYPHEHSREEQIYRGKLLWERQGWRAWPACTRKLGFR